MAAQKNEIKIHSIKYNLVMNIILKISQYIFPLITLPYVTRTLGTVGNGKIAFSSSVIAYFSMFAQSGIPSYGVHECARCRDDKDKLTKTVQELLLLNGIFAVITYIGLVISILMIEKFRQESVLLTVYSVTIFLNMAGIEWLYQAIEQYQYITVRNILFKIISVFFIFIWIHNPEDYILYAILSVMSSGGSCILNLWNSRKVLEHKTFWGQYDLKRHLKPVLVFFTLSVAVSIYTSMDTVMLGFISGDEQVAYYSLATRIKMVLAMTISALGPVLLPRITYCLNNGREQKFKEYIEKSIHFVILASIPVTIFFVVMSPQVIDILGGAEYKPAVYCMQIITLAVIPLGIGNVACSQILTPRGKEKLVMYSTICGAVINFSANMILIPRMGAAGAALATVIAEGIIACIQVYYVQKDVKDIFRRLPYAKFIVANLAAAMILPVLKNAVKIQNLLVYMAVSCALFFSIYGLVLFFLQDRLIYQYSMQYIRKIKSKKK